MIHTYEPKLVRTPEKLIQVASAWKGIESIIEDIMITFNVDGNKFLEFGVEFGYSTVAFSNFFKEVTGVDIFIGDIHTSNKDYHYEATKERLSLFNNIKLVMADYKDYIANNNEQYDMTHVDIVHTYEDTFKCGLWCAKHSKVTLFHDTESFIDVKNAVADIASITGKTFYNFTSFYGLGIIA